MSNEVLDNETSNLSHEDVWKLLEADVKGNSAIPEDTLLADGIKAVAWKIILLEQEIKC